MGCAPGSGCCDACGDHSGPPIGEPASHVHLIPTNRNSALYARLRGLPDDPGLADAVAQWAADERSQMDQQILNAQLLSGRSAPSSGVKLPSSEILAYIGVAAVLAILLLKK